tara:strand:+ start:300 stop:518 length:219 start_codon:yes stop_codon:yes gene_type:complete
VSIDDPIASNLALKFQSEKLSRIINECHDLDILKEIGREFLKLNKSKSAIADWVKRRAAQAEFSSIGKKFIK